MPHTEDPAAPRVAVVGATGAVGTTLLQLFTERDFRYRSLELVASARSAGSTITADGAERRVHDLATFDFGEVDLAFFSAGTSVSEQWVPVATQAGALVIDNTNAYRMDPGTPLVVPQVNADQLAERPASGVIANPNCSTIPLVRLLRPVHRRWGLARVVASTYQAASGRGLSGMAELRDTSRDSLDRPDRMPEGERFSPALAFNVVPSIDRLLDSGFTLEEQKMTQESRKILGLPHLDVTATCVRVPVLNCHSEAVWVECAEPVDRRELVRLLAGEPEVAVHGRDEPGRFPTPRTATEADLVHVGRIRVTPQNPRAFWLWLVADNLRIGAALNAVQIAERLPAYGWRLRAEGGRPLAGVGR
ncbi:aspartate-semialdehyde dehydrogenase [Actinoplanes sp. N902-109]|uniref:aspartate-semialdehyde dehydrogenase n=1 Tax=Actinoplanes sp. (strain N902-109) TaxID=649831 RepID=UPI0003294FC4|nr:aspartate-semialdehyde dehydrogenase [Actinoplanes sp. N902-109]AGL18133.1 aspartate-semialdehyde dehydrogenase [Actinoplanes sp. N902-109]